MFPFESGDGPFFLRAFLDSFIWVSPKIPSRKTGRPNSCHNITRKSQTNIITISNTMNTIILSRRPIFFRIVVREFLDSPISTTFEGLLKEE